MTTTNKTKTMFTYEIDGQKFAVTQDDSVYQARIDNVVVFQSVDFELVRAFIMAGN